MRLRRRGSHPPGRPARAGRLLLLSAALLLTLPALLFPYGSAGDPNAVRPVAKGSVSLSVAVTNFTTLPSTFWGADLRVYYPLNSTNAASFNSSGLHFVRWPGGAVADQYNLTANTITGDDGSQYVPPSNAGQFVRWCRWVSCNAIVQLPVEIDSPSTAASEVAYLEHVVGFHPAYYELGNEPARWSHFGTPWAKWNTSQATNATPTTYARAVQAYASAIHAVDAKARLIGLPGVGTGGYGEAGWIRATVALNGPNLSAVAIHVYPAGGTTQTNVSNATFVATLSGHGSLAYRVPLDIAAIHAACAKCGSLGLFVTEMGSGTAGGPYAAWMAGFLDVPYLAAEVVQALSSSAQNLDIFAFQSTYNGSLLTASASPSPEFTLYSEMLSQLGPVVRNVSLLATTGSLFCTSTLSLNGTVHTLLFVNANVSASVHLSLTGSGFPLAGPGTSWLWAGGMAHPKTTTWTLNLSTAWTVPPASVLEVQITA